MTNPAKHFVFTVNNFNHGHIVNLNRIGFGRTNYDVAYMCWAEEIGASGTPHLQGFISFARKLRFRAISRFPGLEGAHLEVARGSPAQCKAYIDPENPRSSEDGKVPGTNFVEWGELPGGQGDRTDLATFSASIISGSPMDVVAQAHPEVFVKYSTGLIRLAALSQPKRDFKTIVHWFYGPTGSGKSHAAREEGMALSPDRDLFYKMGGNSWWCGYDSNPVVIIDDYRRDLCPFHELLRLMDKYPCSVQVKGATVQFFARHLFITTPKSPRDTWEGRSDEDIQQLLRRIEHVVHYPRMFVLTRQEELPYNGGV